MVSNPPWRFWFMALCQIIYSDIPFPDFSYKRLPPPLSKIKTDHAYWELVEVSALVLKEAGEVIFKTDLRTLDAIHLASILTFQAASGIQVPIITGDSRQRQAAVHLGLDSIWVG